MPTSVVKLLADDVAVSNRSMTRRESGVQPAVFKLAFITSAASDLDATDVRSFRPIWNLSIISKLLD